MAPISKTKRIGKALLALVLVPVLTFGLLLAFPPERWIANQIESHMSKRAGYRLTIGDLDLSLLQASPALTARSVSLVGVGPTGLVEAGQIEAVLDLSALLDWRLLIDRMVISDTTLRLERGADGISTWERVSVPSLEPRTKAAFPAVRSLILDDVKVSYRDAAVEREAAFSLVGDLTTLVDEPASTVTMEGHVDGVSARAELTMATADAPADSDDGRAEPAGSGSGNPSRTTASDERSYGQVIDTHTSMSVDLAASIADVRMTVNGLIGRPDGQRVVDLDFTLSADRLDTFEPIVRLKLPALAPLTLQGTLLADGSEFVVRRFDLASTDSTAQGDLRLDPTATPVSFYANIISRTLDAGALLDVLDNFTTDDAESSAAVVTAESTNGRLFSDAPLAFDRLFAPIQGATDLRIEEIIDDGFTLDAIDLGFTYTGEEVVTEIRSMSIADGMLSGRVELDRQGATDLNATVELELSRLDIEGIVRSLGIADTSRGRVGGRARFWTGGDSVAALAASLDGGVFLLAEDGHISDYLVEIAGLDLFQALGDVIASGSGKVDLRCAYLDLQSEAGTVDVAHFVVDTVDTIFLGSGEIDLADETLDLQFEPHPKDNSLIAASTAIGISGAMQSPEFDMGASLPARGAAMLALAALATPALALLPLIEIGSGENSPFCSNLNEALPE